MLPFNNVDVAVRGGGVDGLFHGSLMKRFGLEEVVRMTATTIPIEMMFD